MWNVEVAPIVEDGPSYVNIYEIEASEEAFDDSPSGNYFHTNM